MPLSLAAAILVLRAGTSCGILRVLSWIEN